METGTGKNKFTAKTKNVGETLLRTWENLQAFAKNTPFLIIKYSKAGDCLEVNPDFENRFFLSREQLLGGNIKDLFPENIAAPFLECITKALEENSFQRLEYELTAPVGKLWFEACFQPLGTDEVLTLIRDITDYKLMEQKLQETHKHFNEIVEFLPDATFVLKNGKVFAWNKAMEKITGIPKEEMLGKGDYEYSLPFYGYRRPILLDLLLISDEKRDEWSKTYRQINWDGEVLTGEMFVPELYGGKGAYLAGSATRLHDATGNIIGAIESIHDITDRNLALERIRHISFHDALTGLYNRRFLEEEMQRLDTERQLPISIIMADLNVLKLVNDIFGHSAGDEILKNTAEALRTYCRQEDIISRWGGDEFIIFLPQTTAKEAEEICARIKEKCSKIYVRDIPISIALGAATKTGTGTSLTEIIKEAEEGMYKQKVVEGRSINSGVLETFLKNLRLKSAQTGEQTKEIKKVALLIGEKLQLPDSELNRLGLLVNLHNIGKVNIPREILNKKEPLTPQEWKEIKKHPEVGYRIISAIEGFAHIAEEILAHHENWDGTGYPRGLKGKEIPLLARITAVASAYEAMHQGRPYKTPLPLHKIKTELQNASGTQFDPLVVTALLQIVENKQNKTQKP